MAFDVPSQFIQPFGDQQGIAKQYGDAFQAFQQAQNFSKENAAMAYLPQQLYQENLMNKIKALQAMRPVDLGMIQKFSDANMNTVAQIQQSIMNGGNPMGGGESPAPGPAPAAAPSGDRPKIGATSLKKGQKNVAEPGNGGNALADQIALLRGAQQPQAPAAPPVPDTQAQIPALDPQSQPQQTINLNDPMALSRAASNMDPNALVNPGTYTLMKDIIGPQSNILRYVAPATGRVTAEQMGTKSREAVADKNNKTKITVQSMKNKADDGPYQLDPKEEADLFNKTMGEFVKQPVLAMTNPQGLVAAIDSLPDGTNAKSRAMQTWGPYYNKIKASQPPPQATPAQQQQAQTPQSKVTVDQLVKAASDNLDASHYPISKDPITGVQKKVIPLALWQQYRAALLKNKAPLSAITNLSQRYIIGQ